MNRVRILTTRVFTKKGYNLGQNYINDLHLQVQHNPGFIKGTSYWTEDLKMVTLSEWKNKKEWEDWKESKYRKDIYNYYKDDIELEEHTELFKIIKTMGFLL